jgi:C-terminal processing protease CtpA/Prc
VRNRLLNSFLHFTLCALLPLLVAACVRTTPETLPAAPTQNVLSREERAEIFEQVWKAIDDEYYDPKFRGLDWRAVGERYRPLAGAARTDAEFYGVFELMLAELRDGHTDFVQPRPPGVPGEGGAHGRLGLKLGDAEGGGVVVEVEPGSKAESLGVRPGQVLREVNGRPVEEHVNFIRSKVAGSSTERLFRVKILSALLYGGFLAKPRTLGLTDFDGREFTVELTEETGLAEPPDLTARRLESGAGYVKFRSWTRPVQEEFAKALATMKDAPGVVIDLRGNHGGEASVVQEIAGHFFARATDCGGFRARDGAVQKYNTRPAPKAYAGPVVILVDSESASASEGFTAFMQESGRARVVGRQTAGSTLNRGGHRQFKGGGQLFFSTRSYLTPRGREIEGVGVTPDLTVPLTRADLRAGRDAALEAAGALLRAPPVRR